MVTPITAVSWLTVVHHHKHAIILLLEFQQAREHGKQREKIHLRLTGAIKGRGVSVHPLQALHDVLIRFVSVGHTSFKVGEVE